ncbi:MAG: transporter substrate-binding domain-containing protein [Arenicellales bacterium]
MKYRNILAATASAAVLLTTATTQAGEALDRVMSENMLKIATSASWAPQSFLNDNNEMDGFDVDVAREVAKRLGVEAKFVTPAWDIITAGKWNGRWDVSVGSMTPTESRSRVLSFPAVYYYTPAVVAVHEDSKATTIADLNGKKMGAGTNSTFELYLKKDLTIDAEGAPAFEYKIDAGEIKSYANSSAVFDDLRLGDGTRLDGTVDALPAILKAAENNYPFKIIGSPVFYEPLALAIDKGDDEFNDKLAGIIAAMRSDGTLTALSKKWYDVDYTIAK